MKTRPEPVGTLSRSFASSFSKSAETGCAKSDVPITVSLPEREAGSLNSDLGRVGRTYREISELPDDTLLEVGEVAEWLRVDPAWVRAHANGSRRPLLPSIKLGAFRRFIKADIQQFLRQLKGGS